MNTIKIKRQNNEFLFIGVLTFDTAFLALEQTKKLLTKKDEEILVNLGGVSKSDSAALSLMVELMRFVREQNMSLKISNIPKKMMDLARVSGLDSLLPIIRET